MEEDKLRSLIGAVKDGRTSRRGFVQRMLAVGISAPMAGMMLSHHGVVWPDATLPSQPRPAGGGGQLKLLLCQAPTLLTPQFASGTKDQIAARIFFEPLAGWDKEGNLIPPLAAEAPSRE